MKKILPIIIAVLVYSFFIFTSDLKQLIKYFSSINLVNIILFMILAFVGYLFRFIKWIYLTKQGKFKISIKKNFLIFFSGLAFTLTPGKLGDFAKAYFLGNFSKGFPIVLLERFSDLIALIILAMIGKIESFFLTIPIVLLFIGLKYKKIYKFLLRIPFISKYEKQIFEAYEASKNLFSLKNFIISISLSLPAWALEGIGLSLISGINILKGIFSFSISTVFGTLSILPGGLGVFEASLPILLMNYGFNYEKAIVITIITRLCTLFFGFFIGLVSFYFLNKYKDY